MRPATEDRLWTRASLKANLADHVLLWLSAGLGASLATLRRRVRYGGRKGRRAVRRLRAAGVRP